jgi:predicted nucleic acid-binding protein
MSPSRVVIDASVALAWLLDEQRPDWLDDLRDDLADGRVELSAPSLFWLEVGNALARRTDLADEQAVEGLLRLEGLGISTIELDRPLRLVALTIARQHALTTYDAVYLALASSLPARLATLDARLAGAAAGLGLAYRQDAPRSMREPSAAYAGPGAGRSAIPDTRSLATLGAHLAELRRSMSL